MNSMKFYEQDKYFMEKMKYLNKGRNKNKNNKNNNNNNNKNNNFQTCRTVRDSLTVKNWNSAVVCNLGKRNRYSPFLHVKFLEKEKYFKKLTLHYFDNSVSATKLSKIL